jgi:hypothetical protein
MLRLGSLPGSSVLHQPSRRRLNRGSGVAGLHEGVTALHDPTLWGEDQFNVSEAQAEDVVQPGGMANDLIRKAVAGVGGGIRFHRGILTQPFCSGQNSTT